MAMMMMMMAMMQVWEPASRESTAALQGAIDALLVYCDQSDPMMKVRPTSISASTSTSTSTSDSTSTSTSASTSFRPCGAKGVVNWMCQRVCDKWLALPGGGSTSWPSGLRSDLE